jgi:ATP-dependent DNA helicase RecG
MSRQYLQTPIEYLKGVGPKRAELLRKELGIHTFNDLLYHFPFRYIDRSKFYKINEIRDEQTYVQLKGKLTNIREVGEKRGKRLTAWLQDDTGMIELVWFRGLRWIKSSIREGMEYVVFGKPTLFRNRYNLAHPDLEDASQYETSITETFEGIYSSTEKLKNSGLNNKNLVKLQKTLISGIRGTVQESLPGYILNKLKLLPLEEALVQIHFPTGQEMLKKATGRLKFEELFFIQLKLLKEKKGRQKTVAGYSFSKVGELTNSFYKENLPFELTGAQKKVIREIRRDLGSGNQMNRLLQGDVGSGKTLVALMAGLIAIDNGFQCAIMAPTEILATQHFNSISKFARGLGIQIELLTGSTPAATRNDMFGRLASGELKLLIGTHALIEDRVVFKNLGLVVIDEQHRFGVAQRARLWQKGQTQPHVLVMTATPIPRTLAMTMYGDLDLSVIDEMPPGRKPVKTYHYRDSARLRLFGFMRKKISEGRQVYIVYPLIKESEKLDLKDLQDGYESIVRSFPLPEYAVSIVHGKMKPADKDYEMQRFIRRETQIMVATTVIEVGVDIPNASVMVIENAERFGLSQLHQLRGRVGRGADQSYCILMTGDKLTNEARTRIQTMVGTTDGFEIAEADLRLRGPGDIQGTQQSGMLNLKLASLVKDEQILSYARGLAKEILDEDPSLSLEKNNTLRIQLKHLYSDLVDWGKIS